jgi:hypothetical protein
MTTVYFFIDRIEKAKILTSVRLAPQRELWEMSVPTCRALLYGRKYCPHILRRSLFWKLLETRRCPRSGHRELLDPSVKRVSSHPPIDRASVSAAVVNSRSVLEHCSLLKVGTATSRNAHKPLVGTPRFELGTPCTPCNVYLQRVATIRNSECRATPAFAEYSQHYATTVSCTRMRRVA